MFEYFDILSPALWMSAFLIAFVAGVIKGVVGFALPTVIIVGLGSILSPELALAGLIIPTLATNSMQALRLGPRSALRVMKQFRLFLLTGGVTMALAAQLVTVVPTRVYFLLIGVPIIVFVATQLAGWKARDTVQTVRSETTLGVLTGFFGGISGTWGPTTVAYLTALGTEKRTQMQIQGVVYGLGAVVLLFAHVGSGILNKSTIWLSLGMTVPAILGMAAGTVIQDRIDQTRFRQATLVVLLLAGMNLVRRGLIN
jgi:uncharacterized membrane protein YfcA